MGVLLNSAYLMMVEGSRTPFSGKVLQLGRQSILFSFEALSNLAAHAGFVLRAEHVDPTRSRMTDIEFFKALGFDEVESMEYGTEENATYVWDMNYPVQYPMYEKFDFIYDGGTIEHVFNVPVCMNSVCLMLKVGGRIFHESAVSGTIDHGFYAIQPTFYHDFYTAQEFKVDLIVISKIDPQTWLSSTGTQRLYKPGMYDFNATWAFDADCAFTGNCFATKTRQYFKMVIPQQSLWKRAADFKKGVA